jgi:hypothetical protein
VPDAEDAFGYFPNLAANLLGDAVSQCHGEFGCVANFFARHRQLQKDGTFESRLILKRIEDGKYVR